MRWINPRAEKQKIEAKFRSREIEGTTSYHSGGGVRRDMNIRR